MLSKKYYQLIADELRAARELESLPSSQCAVERVSEGLATLFKRDNPRFDTHRFLNACGIYDN